MGRGFRRTVLILLCQAKPEETGKWGDEVILESRLPVKGQNPLCPGRLLENKCSKRRGIFPSKCYLWLNHAEKSMEKSVINSFF